MPKCGSRHPEDPARVCLLTTPVHADHMDAQGTWPSPEVIERVRTKAGMGGKRAVRKHLTKIAAEAAQGRVETLRRERVSAGIPVVAEMRWTQDLWVPYAEQVFIDFLSSHPDPFTTAEALWPRLDKPEEMRCFSVVTRTMLRTRRMHEVGARRLRGVYRTQDGHEFAENKIVPVYQSLVASP